MEGLNPETVTIGALIVFLGPVIVNAVTSFLKRCSWPDYVKTALCFLVSIVVTAIPAYELGQFSNLTVLGYVVAVFGLAVVHYQKWFQGLAFNKWLENIEVF